jgi:hypothetical protein
MTCKLITRKANILLGFDGRELPNSDGKGKRHSTSKEKQHEEWCIPLSIKSLLPQGARAGLFIGEVKCLITMP